MVQVVDEVMVVVVVDVVNVTVSVVKKNRPSTAGLALCWERCSKSYDGCG